MIKAFDEIVKSAKNKGPKTLAVAVAQDAEVLTAVNTAKDLGIAEAILVGDKGEILKAAGNCGVELAKFTIIDEKDKTEACRKAVSLIDEGKAHIVMKGLVDTAIILKAVLAEEAGLRTGNVLSHVAVFEVNGYDRLFIVTDAAMNIAPNLEQKKQIIENAVKVAHAMGNEEPKVAVLAAVEKVNPKMQATLDADALTEMNSKGEIRGCQIAGPFALDNAVSAEAARHKGIDHPVAGHADILMVPQIEAGNMLYKSMVFFAKAQNAGIIVGAKVPIVLTSRADSDIAKLNSIAIGVLMS
ncbi:phosphate butyryltransferase [Lutispora saccharofermentans]|uniref:Phosphate butyryltransferase n=1 Tax=Lutispora saccharofermentans TaxID=3024236 RepID=A0ABT1NJQ7_9FIRM|nr:phosphate butyryltransferase [Lutispora saccharofermentans]MCQ1531507.1 phosphate butyryltransferase [Lutispora saccharofermentans]